MILPEYPFRSIATMPIAILGTKISGAVSAPPFPINISSGIGYLINPSNLTDEYSLHDHVYIAPYVPDPSRAVITFQFAVPTVVEEIEVVEHANGVTKLHGYAGDSLETLTDIGAVFGSLGDLTGECANA